MGSFCRGRDGTRRIVSRDKKEEPTGFVVVVLEGKCNIATGTSFDCTNIDERIIIIIIKEEEERGVAPAAKNWHGPTSTFHRLSMGIDDGAQGENVCADLRDLLPPLFFFYDWRWVISSQIHQSCKIIAFVIVATFYRPITQETAKKTKRKKPFSIARAMLPTCGYYNCRVTWVRPGMRGVVDPWRKDTWTWREFIITAPQGRRMKTTKWKDFESDRERMGEEEKGEFLFGLCRSRTKSRGTTEPRLRGGGCWKEEKTFTLWLPLHDSLVLVAALNGCRVLKKQREEAVQPFAAFTLYPDTFPFFSVWGLPYCRPAWPRSVHAGGARKREKKEKNFPNK